MKKVKNILLIIFYFAFSLIFLGLGIYKLCGFSNTYQTTLVGAVEFFENEHSIDGLIPIGTSYYYLGITDDNGFVIVQANQNWLNDNFDSEGYAKNTPGVTVKGEITRLPSDAQSYAAETLTEYLAEYTDYNIPLGQKSYMNIFYIDSAVHSVIVGSLMLIAGIAVAVISKNEALKEKFTQSKVLFWGSIIVALLILCYFFYVTILIL